MPGSWPDAVKVVRLPENLGIPGGRNKGVEASSGELLASEKPNIACTLGDFAHVNAVLATPQAIKNLVDTLDLNHFFFGGVEKLVAPSSTNPYKWFRVFFLPPQQPPARQYAKRKPVPNVYGADACRSMYGNGVGPARQNPAPKLLTGSKVVLGH